VTAEQRERLNLKAIRVSAYSGLRHASPELSAQIVAEAVELTLRARRRATSDVVRREADALHAELTSFSEYQVQTGE
jgi:hypothetical protein